MESVKIAEFERLELMFRRGATLPPLPKRALQLIRVIDDGEAGARDLEQIILGDPALSVEFLRLSSHATAMSEQPSASLLRVIPMLGQRTVRTITSSPLL